MGTIARLPWVKVKEQLMRPKPQDDHARVNGITSVLIRIPYTSLVLIYHTFSPRFTTT